MSGLSGIASRLAKRAAGFTAQRQAEILLRLAQAEGAAGHRHGDLRQPLGENPSRATVIDAAKAADAQVKFDPAALPRQIRQPATIAAVSSDGGIVAQRALRRRTGRMRFKDEMIVGEPQTIDCQVGISTLSGLRNTVDLTSEREFPLACTNERF